MVAVAKQKSEIAIAFGRRLRELRGQHKLTLGELGKRAEMAYSAVARLERGERMPGLDTLIQLADALGVRLDELRGEFSPGVGGEPQDDPEPPKKRGKK